MAKPDKVFLKQQARDRALMYTWEQINRHRLRYQPRDFAAMFDLTSEEVTEIEEHYKAVDYPARLVVVNLPDDVDLTQAKQCAVKASSKCYMTGTVVTFELGDTGDHPHYNFLFISGVEWLAKSRIIREFASTFKIDRNYVNVTHLTLDDYSTQVEGYISKEDIWKLDKRPNRAIRQACSRPHVSAKLKK